MNGDENGDKSPEDGENQSPPCQPGGSGYKANEAAAERNSRRRSRPMELTNDESTSTTTTSSSLSLFQEAEGSDGASETNIDERVKRKCNRQNDSPQSSESFASLDEPVEAEEAPIPSDSQNDEEEEEDVDAVNEDEVEDDDDSDDADELPIHFRPRPAKEPNAATESPAVLKKSQSKPRYSFVQDYLASQQFSMKPREFIRRRMGDLSLVQRLSMSHKLEGHTGCVNAIHFNESGSMLASGSDDLDIYVWDWQRGKKMFSFKSGHSANVFQSKFLPLTGDTHIVTTSRDGQVRLAELSVTGSCRSTKKVAQHKGASHKIALVTNKPHEFISGGEDGLIIEVDVRQPKPNKLLVQKEDGKLVPIYSVHSNPADEHLLVSAGSDQFIRLYDRRFASQSSPDPMAKFCPSHLKDVRCHITCAVFSNDGREIIGSFSDEDIYMFHTHSNGEEQEFVKRYQGHCNSATVKGVNFYGPDCEYVVSGSDCGNIFFWDKFGEDIVHVVKGDDNGVVNCLEPHPNLPMMATSGLDDEVKIWKPIAEEKAALSKIEKAVMENADRSAHRTHGPGSIIGGQMIWHILRQFQRTERLRRRRRAAENGEENRESDEGSTSDTEGMDDDNDEDDEPIQCAPS